MSALIIFFTVYNASYIFSESKNYIQDMDGVCKIKTNLHGAKTARQAFTQENLDGRPVNIHHHIETQNIKSSIDQSAEVKCGI